MSYPQSISPRKMDQFHQIKFRALPVHQKIMIGSPLVETKCTAEEINICDYLGRSVKTSILVFMVFTLIPKHTTSLPSKEKKL